MTQSNETRLQALACEPDPDTPKDLLHVRATARPLFFSSDDPGIPFGGVGTCFVVAYCGQIFVITANHLIKETHSKNVMVFPFDGAERPMKLSNGYRSEHSTDDDPSDYDIIIYKATLNALPGENYDAARAIRLDAPSSYRWTDTSYTAQFFLFGYPREINGIDYESSVVDRYQVLLPGKYLGASNWQATVHTLQIDNHLALTDFGGFSGSPVFSTIDRLGGTPATALKLLLGPTCPR